MNMIKIKSVTLRYDSSRGWPWLLVYRNEHGEASIAFPFRRDAITFAHRRGWSYTEENRNAIQ